MVSTYWWVDVLQKHIYLQFPPFFITFYRKHYSAKQYSTKQTSMMQFFVKPVKPPQK